MIAWLLACAVSDPDPSDAPTAPVDLATPAAGWLRGDLHFHTNYSDDALEQGGDWMGPALDIAHAWSDPAWKAAFPEYAPGDQLDFVAVTDHRTDAGWADPDFGHDHLVVLAGEEFGSDGHAGVWGADAHIPHEPQGGESANQRLQDAIGEAHAQGGLFSVNHPLYSGDLWAWDTTGFDAVEVWNGAWSTMGSPTDEAALDQWIAEKGGDENPWIRAAVRATGVPQNAQAMRFWQEILSSGAHPAPVGGGDRHMIFPAGLPTTYIATDSATPEGVLAGIAGGSTFVSRGPQGPQVLLEAVLDGTRHPMGADLPGPGVVTVEWRVGRADGGELRLWAGATGVEPGEVATFPIAGDDARGSWTWDAPAGGWLHAVVVDPLPVDVPEDRQAAADAFLQFPDDGGLGALIGALAPLIDLTVLTDPSRCDPSEWDAWSACCMTVDTVPYATFYLPDPIQRLMSAEFRDGEPTGWSMGAISAAFLVGR